MSITALRYSPDNFLIFIILKTGQRLANPGLFKTKFERQLLDRFSMKKQNKIAYL